MLKRLPSRRKSTATPLLSSISLWRNWVTHSRKMLKSTGASTHPCLTPVCTGKEEDSCPPSHPSSHSIMKLAEDVNKLAGAAKVENDFPQEFSLDSVESFGEIDKGYEQVLMLFSAFLLQLSSCENHVHRAPALPETALRAEQQAESNMHCLQTSLCYYTTALDASHAPCVCVCVVSHTHTQLSTRC